jgi:hypothetical protein
MSDDKGKGVTETIADEGKGLAVEVYRDVAKPSAKPVGDVLGRTVNLFLAPVRAALSGAEVGITTLAAAVRNLLSAVPPERLVAPPANIAGPVALHHALLGDAEEARDLREMFERLLATSMDSATAPTAHPAFVSMISQLTAEEAIVLRTIDRNEYASAFVTFDRGDRRDRILRTSLALGAPIDHERLPEYISNLERLGILRQGTYQGGIGNDVLGLGRRLEAELGNDVTISLGTTIVVTPLGERFLATCVRRPASP